MGRDINITLEVDDKGSVTVRKFGKTVDDTGAKGAAFGQKMKGAALGVGSLAGKAAVAVGKVAALGVALGVAAGAAALGKTLTAFAAFESALVDMGKVTGESFASIKKKIMDLSPALGSSTELVRGYYQVISAGVTEPKAAMETLTVASKAAKSAHVEQGEVIKGLTKVMAGYEGQIGTVTEAADLLFTIEKEGQTSFQELIPVIGGLAKVSKDLGVHQNEMGASLALITQTAGSTAEAATQYQAVLIGLMKPTTEMKKAISAMGFESAQAMIKQKGLAGSLQMVKEYTGGSAEKMNALFGRVEAVKGMSALAANNFEALGGKIEAMTNKTGASERAWDNYKNTLSAVWETFKNAIGKQAILIGEKLAPAIKAVLGRVTAWAEANRELISGKLGEWIGKIEAAVKKLIPKLKEWYAEFKNNIGPTLIKVGKSAMWAGEKIAGMINWIRGVDEAEATVKLKGEGSTVKPLGEKIDEMTGKFAGFAQYIEGLKPAMTVDMSQVSNEIERVAQQADRAASRISGATGGRHGVSMYTVEEMRRRQQEHFEFALGSGAGSSFAIGMALDMTRQIRNAETFLGQAGTINLTVAPQFMTGDENAARNVANEIRREIEEQGHRWGGS